VLINLYRDGDNLRFEVNATAVEKSGLRVSAKVLRLARVLRKK
jgi:hypothetical protein